MTSKQITDDATPLTHEIASRMGLRDIGATFHGDVWCPSFYSGGRGRVMRLSIAQMNLLKSIELGSCSCIDTYKPMLALVREGLAEYHAGSLGHGNLTITGAGKMFLLSLPTHKETR